MARPGLRPMRVLPLLEPSRDALEKCVFCPKLCRSACPVSNAEPRETITPWGKMSAAWMVAHGDVPADASTAAPAWACTGCAACRESCDHRNTVTEVLLQARDGLSRAGLAPEGARRTVTRFPRHDHRTRAAARALARSSSYASPASRDGLLVGCGYLRAAPNEAAAAVAAASALVGGPVAVIERCCGLPLLLAGDALGFAQQAREAARAMAHYERVWVADAGCAVALLRRYREAGVPLRPAVETIVEGAARKLDLLTAVGAEVAARGPVRWHDPCQLGRVLGVYEAPRAVLTRALGRAPDELEERREGALCSGAGGLLPSTMPENARTIAATRLAAHERAGGGRVVTACASSLIALRRRAAGSGVPVDDLVTWIARAAQPEVRSPTS